MQINIENLYQLSVRVLAGSCFFFSMKEIEKKSSEKNELLVFGFFAQVLPANLALRILIVL